MYLKNISLCFIWFVMLSATFFSDFLPMPHGAYADQRFILCLSLVLLVALTISFIDFSAPNLVIIVPLLLSLTIGGYLAILNPFNWLEPILYCFFFITICLLGHFIVINKLQVKASRCLIGLSVLVCFFYASLSLMLYVFSLETSLSNFSDVMPAGFVNIRYWSHTATWLLPLFPLAVIGFGGSQYRLWRFMVMFTAAIWWWLAIHMMSRGSISSLVIATIIVLILFRKAAFPWLKLMCTYLVMGVLTWFLLSYVVPEWILNVEATLLRDIKTTTSGRLPLWEEAWAMSLQNFPFGMGAQSWLTHELLTSSYKAAVKFSHPHNMYLMWAAEYGWISVLSLFCVILWVFFRIKERSKELIHNSKLGSQEIIGFTVASIAGCVHAGVSAVFIVPASMMLGLGVLSVFWALILPVSDHEQVNKVSRYQSIKRASIMLLFLMLSIWWLLQVWNYHESMVKDLATDEGAAVQEMAPRFWIYGNYPRPATLKAIN